jgi:hypothetical protein
MTKYEFCIESTNNKFDNGEITLEQYLLIIDKLNNESIENDDYHTESLKTSQKIAIGAGAYTGIQTVRGLAAAQRINADLDEGEGWKQSDIVKQGVIIGLIRVFGVNLISKLVNNNRFKKLHKDVSMMNSPMSVKYIDGKSFMKLTKNTENVNKNAKVRVWHIDNVPLAYMTTSDINAGIALTDIKYKILLPTLKGGGFEEDLKSFVENEKNALKQNLKNS